MSGGTPRAAEPPVTHAQDRSQAMGHAIAGVARQAYEVVSGLAGKPVTTVKGWVDSARNTVSKAVNSAATKVSDSVDKARAVIASRVSAAVTTVGNWARNAATTVWGWLQPIKDRVASMAWRAASFGIRNAKLKSPTMVHRTQDALRRKSRDGNADEFFGGTGSCWRSQNAVGPAIPAPGSTPRIGPSGPGLTAA